MIRRCSDRDLETIWTIINDAAEAYRSVIPADRWKEPYMSKAELEHEIDEGVAFWGYDEEGELIGVMGIQPVEDVTLIRHAYVRPQRQGEGIGGRLLSHLRGQTELPILIGTWADALWAIRFYEHHGFQLVSPEEKERLLRRYWSIPNRQIETSVVLANPRWVRGERPEWQQRTTTPGCPPSEAAPPERLVRFCGADCGRCDTYRAFLAGDESGLVNPQTAYRCCWLPAAYPEGRDCLIKTCCEERGVRFCGECDQLDQCVRMQAFYAQPGYEALRTRMFRAMESGRQPSHTTSAHDPPPDREMG